MVLHAEAISIISTVSNICNAVLHAGTTSNIYGINGCISIPRHAAPLPHIVILTLASCRAAYSGEYVPCTDVRFLVHTHCSCLSFTTIFVD